MPDLDDELLQELLSTFRAEAAEHLQTMNQSLLKLERAPDATLRPKIVRDAFRAAHSLKGAARAVSQREIEALAHTMESVFQQARDTGLVLNADICDVLYDALDVIEQILNGQAVDIDPLQVRLVSLVESDVQFAAPGSDGAVIDAPANQSSLPMEDTIRVSINKLDDLMAQVGELLVARISTEQRLTEARQISHQFDLWAKSWREVRAIAPKFDGEAGRRLHTVLEQHSSHVSALLEAYRKLDQGINRDAVRLGIVTTGLQDRVRNVRMVPFQVLVFALERAVRDAARTTGKSVRFAVEGSHIELDKKILEIMKDPLLHLIRNAVAHGVEPATERVAASKPAEGLVLVRLQQRGNEVHIDVSDDGRGFDFEALRSAYVRRTGTALDENASEEEILGLAFLPGVTTANEVTALAGRGVGLDVVRQSLASIQGRISVESVPGGGTQFHLVVPTSLALMRGLLVQVGSERYALPLLAIEKIIEPQEMLVVAGRQMVKVDGKPLPIAPLAQVLQRPVADTGHPSQPLAVILSVANQRVALLVDDVVTEQELAVKTLGKLLQHVPNVTGAALLGSGEPIVILNPADLVKAAWQATSHDALTMATPQPDVAEQIHILVVDDSITTRTLEKNILEAAGFLVTTATDGIEALKRLGEHGTIRLVVADVEMPNMDGIALVETLRADPTYASLPIVLVTSLESPEDRERGMFAGADAYIVKRGFDQAELLATIQHLL